MTFIDIVLAFVLIVFMFMGYKSGFVQKIIGIICFAVALVIATKYSADISDVIYEPIGVTGRMGFILAFLTIVLGITLMQSFIYKALFKNGIQGIWNHIGGILIGTIEGGLTISVVLIIMSIYMKLPSDETKATSILYKPLKNFAPVVFDQINTFLPESEDFYQQMFKSASKDMKKGEKKQ